MKQNAQFPSFLIDSLQQEYSLQLANLQMQMLQRSVLFNGITPIFSSPLHFSSFLEGRMVHQNQLMLNQPQLMLNQPQVALNQPQFVLNQPQLSENIKEQKVEVPKNDPKKSSRVLHSEQNNKFIEKLFKLLDVESSQKTKTEKELSKGKIEAMLEIFLAGSGSLPEKDTDSINERLKKDPKIASLFNSISQRYLKFCKSNEEMQRYTIFRGIKWMRTQIMKRDSLKYFETLEIFVQEYLLPYATIQDSKILKTFAKQIDDFGKSPRDKIIHTRVAKLLVSSSKFLKEFKTFLSHIDKIMKKENDQRKAAFVAYLQNCLTRNNLSKIQLYKRVPWPAQWMEETKNIGSQVLDGTLFEFSNQKTKADSTNDESTNQKKRAVDEESNLHDSKVSAPKPKKKLMDCNKELRIVNKSEEEIVDEENLSCELSDDTN